MWVTKFNKIGEIYNIQGKQVYMLVLNLVEKTVQGLTGKYNTIFIFHSSCNQSNIK